MENEYLTSWLIYLSAALGAHLLLWRVLVVFSNTRWIHYSHCLLAAVLFTPVSLELDGRSGYLVPAFMAALMDGLNDGFDAALPKIWLMLGFFVALIFFTLLFRVYISQRRPKKLQPDTSQPTQ
jgi:hypothetical protein